MEGIAGLEKKAVLPSTVDRIVIKSTQPPLAVKSLKVCVCPCSKIAFVPGKRVKLL